MKAVVIGGTGATGSELVKQLLQDARFEEVVVLVRRPSFEKQAKLTEVVVDFEKLNEYGDQIQGNVAFSCLGTTRKAAGSKDAQWRVDHDYQLTFAAIAKANKIESFVLLSAAGAHENSSFFYSKMKGALENTIQKLDFEQFVVLQPGAIERPNSDRMGEKIAVNLLKACNALGLFRSYKPIATDRLAKAMIAAYFTYKQRHKMVNLDEIHHLTTTGLIFANS